MKFKYLVLSAATALILSVSGLPSHQLTAQAGEMSRPQINNRAMSKQTTGKFVAAEHPTQGAVSIINEDGKRYLVFDKTFKSDMGPDLYVILYRGAVLPKGGLKEADYIDIGRLQKVSGTQRYALPNDVNLANYRSVAVWCRQFNTTFGYAILPTQTLAQAEEKSGNFIAAEHPTQGAVSITNKNGKRYLEFDETFKSDMGPDLHIILHRSAVLPIGGLKEADYIIIGRLQKVSGTQRYAIPNNVNLDNFSSVAVWCRMFNATFGYAPLPIASIVQR